jgi:tungstate transport system ATP-binding protein
MGLRLELSRISKAYNSTPVLWDCSVSFAGGTATVLMGPNGSGKSTLLRIAALLEKPDGGEVKFFSGNNLLANDLHLRRKITLVLPKIGVFNTTIYQNMAFALKIRGLKAAEIEARVDELLAVVGLKPKKYHRALELSSGETKRLGIARAMVFHPEVLFLDEPTASLDPLNAEIIEAIIAQIKKAGRATVIITTHDQAQAKRLADLILVMDRSRVVPA